MRRQRFCKIAHAFLLCFDQAFCSFLSPIPTPPASLVPGANLPLSATVHSCHSFLHLLQLTAHYVSVPGASSSAGQVKKQQPRRGGEEGAGAQSKALGKGGRPLEATEPMARLYVA